MVIHSKVLCVYFLLKLRTNKNTLAYFAGFSVTDFYWIYNRANLVRLFAVIYDNGATTFSMTTFSIMTFGIMTLSKMTLSIMTFSIIGLLVTLSIANTKHNDTLHKH
jgi:hypothetical protein